MANTKELMNFVKSLNDRGLLSKTIEEFDYEWVIWDYQQREVKKLNIPDVSDTVVKRYQETAQLGIGAVMPRLTRKATFSRDNEIIIDLEQLKVEARNRNDEATAQKLYSVIFRLLCLTNEA